MRKAFKRIMIALGALVLAGATVFALGVALIHTVPYQPFVIRDYTVTPGTVCPGADVTATITRRFTHKVSEFTLSETWVTVPGDKPVKGNSGQLPTRLLSPHSEYKTAVSPLLHTAPRDPGTYRVEISTRSVGYRLGIQTKGRSVFYSANTVTVSPTTTDGKKCS